MGPAVGRVAQHRRARTALAILSALTVACFLAPLIAPYDVDAGSLAEVLRRPGAPHWLGTDELGRDVLSRLLWGGRVSLSVAALVTLLAPLVGTLYGLCAGAAPPMLGEPAMRVVDGVLGVPRLPLYLVLLTLVGAGYWSVVVVMAAFEWPLFARLAYTAALGQLREQHVEAARALGATWPRVVRHHVLPNVAGPLVVVAAVGVRGRIMAETSLSYLGFGIVPPIPSWGNMLAGAQSHIWDYPLLAIYPGVAILIVSIAASLLGDSLRDALDPTTSANWGTP